MVNMVRKRFTAANGTGEVVTQHYERADVVTPVFVIGIHETNKKQKPDRGRVLLELTLSVHVASPQSAIYRAMQ